MNDKEKILSKLNEDGNVVLYSEEDETTVTLVAMDSEKAKKWGEVKKENKIKTKEEFWESLAGV